MDERKLEGKVEKHRTKKWIEVGCRKKKGRRNFAIFAYEERRKHKLTDFFFLVCFYYFMKLRIINYDIFILYTIILLSNQ